MAVTQTEANKKGPSLIGIDTSDTIPYRGFGFFGGVLWFTGTGSPNGLVTAPQGSFYNDVDAPATYQNTDASTTWAKISGQ